MNKQCFKCKATKPLSEFYRHKMMADGHLGKCKKCALRDVRLHRLANLEKVRAYDRSRASPERRADTTKGNQRRHAAHPEQRYARGQLLRAVRTGKVAKLPCAFCSKEKVVAHHHDYSKPLDVTWLCPGCHARFHALEKMSNY